MINNPLALLVGFLTGLIPLVVLLLVRARNTVTLEVLSERLSLRETRIQELEEDFAQAERQLAQLGSELSLESEKRAAADAQNSRIPGLENDLANLRTEKEQLVKANAELQTALLKDRESGREKLALLESAREALNGQFKTLANEILEAKSRQFTEQNAAIAERNQTHLGQLLNPLRENLKDFKAKVEEVYVQEGKDRSALAAEVKQLRDLNQTLSDEARNLTSALKGSNKTQGNYGELILERLLEASGLRKGEEYQVQVSHTVDERRLQPDVIINLPENRRLVVDSKVSLDAYLASTTAEAPAEREAAIKAHLLSVQSHIKGLSAKNYQQLHGIESLDFVILFVAIEPAFMLAVAHDKDLFMEAWNRNVLLVSPSTLLFVVRTVAHLWRQEAQTRNAQEIAKRGGDLYDKVAGFVKDFEALGVKLQQAQAEYDHAHGKLASGRGNLIRQTEMLRDLGVKPSKGLPPSLVALARDEMLPELPETAPVAEPSPV